MTDTYKRERIKAKKAKVKDPNCETHHNATQDTLWNTEVPKGMFSEESNNERKIIAFLDNKMHKTRENDMKIELSKAKALNMAFFAKN